MFGHPSLSHRKMLVTDSVESSTLLGQTLEDIDALVWKWTKLTLLCGLSSSALQGEGLVTKRRVRIPLALWGILSCIFSEKLFLLFGLCFLPCHFQCFLYRQLGLTRAFHQNPGAFVAIALDLSWAVSSINALLVVLINTGKHKGKHGEGKCLFAEV